MKKKILVIAPVLPQTMDIEPIVRSLAFLNETCHLDFVDPLAQFSYSNNIDNKTYYQRWQKYLAQRLGKYDALFGFSFGGVILQQCFSLFESSQKTIVLFSTPTQADKPLEKKLGDVIRLCREGKVEQALEHLYQDVFSPNKPPEHAIEIENQLLAADRLNHGLQRVLDTDSTMILKTSTVDHIHLIGECSNLVNRENVSAPKTGQLLVVPNASMRVLQDNLPFCRQAIWARLNHGA